MSEHTNLAGPTHDGAGTVPVSRRWRAVARFFHPPALRVVAHGERRATWLELFFDLVYVVAVAALGQLLHADTSAGGFLAFAGLFVPVWLSWVGYSYYADQFDTNDLRFQLIVVGAMLGSIVLAINVDAAAHGEPMGFVLAYVLLRGLLIGLYLWARTSVPQARTLCTRFLVGMTLGVCLWLLGLLVPAAVRAGVWALALLIEIITPWVAYKKTPMAPVQTSHMPERFGLFTLIVLGEAVVAVANGVAELAWNWSAVLTAVSGFLVAAMLWFVYFGYVDETVIDRALRGSPASLTRGFVYASSHLLIFAAITALSVGIGLAIDEAREGGLPAGTRAALCGGMLVALVGMTISHWAMPYGVVRSVLLARVGLLGLVVALWWAGGALPPAAVVGALAVGMAALIAVELISYREEREAAPL